MEAGYDLDVEVLTKVMHPAGDWSEMTERFFEEPLYPGQKFDRERTLDTIGARYSRDEAAAMRVVDEMVSKGWWPTLRLQAHFVTDTAEWSVTFWRYVDNRAREYTRTHPDRRVCICLAALAAVEGSA